MAKTKPSPKPVDEHQVVKPLAPPTRNCGAPPEQPATITVAPGCASTACASGYRLSIEALRPVDPPDQKTFKAPEACSAESFKGRFRGLQRSVKVDQIPRVDFQYAYVYQLTTHPLMPPIRVRCKVCGAGLTISRATPLSWTLTCRQVIGRYQPLGDSSERQQWAKEVDEEGKKLKKDEEDLSKNPQKLTADKVAEARNALELRRNLWESHRLHPGHKAKHDALWMEWKGRAFTPEFTLFAPIANPEEVDYQLDKTHHGPYDDKGNLHHNRNHPEKRYVMGGHGVFTVQFTPPQGPPLLDHVELQIVGDNPGKSVVKQYVEHEISAYTCKHKLLCIIMHILIHESGCQQFRDSESSQAEVWKKKNGKKIPPRWVARWPLDPPRFPKVAYDFGIGLTQLTMTVGVSISAPMVWDWRDNLASGLNLLFHRKMSRAMKDLRTSNKEGMASAVAGFLSEETTLRDQETAKIDKAIQAIETKQRKNPPQSAEAEQKVKDQLKKLGDAKAAVLKEFERRKERLDWRKDRASKKEITWVEWALHSCRRYNGSWGYAWRSLKARDMEPLWATRTDLVTPDAEKLPQIARVDAPAPPPFQPASAAVPTPAPSASPPSTSVAPLPVDDESEWWDCDDDYVCERADDCA